MLEHELNRRRVVVEEEEARRKGLNTLIAHLKKLQKHQTRKDIEFEVNKTIRYTKKSEQYLYW